jgi:hypothetical protein
MTRYERAVEIRDAALAVIRRIGRMEQLGGCNPVPAMPDHLRYKLAMDGHRVCPYNVNIWVPRRKVFLVSWDDADPRMDITTFVKGDWPAALLQEPVA